MAPTYLAFKHRCRNLHASYFSSTSLVNHHLALDNFLLDLEAFERRHDPRVAIAPPAVRQPRKTVFVGIPVYSGSDASESALSLREMSGKMLEEMTNGDIQIETAGIDAVGATAQNAIEEKQPIQIVAESILQEHDNPVPFSKQDIVCTYSPESSTSTGMLASMDQPSTTVYRAQATLTVSVDDTIKGTDPVNSTLAPLLQTSEPIQESANTKSALTATIPPSPPLSPICADLTTEGHSTNPPGLDPATYTCTGCTQSLIDVSSYICTFPGCRRRYCRTCSWLLVTHPLDGGVDGDLAALLHHWKVERGEANAEDAPAVRVFRKTPATGVAWIMRKLEMNRRAHAEVLNVWGKNAWGDVLGESHSRLGQIDLRRVGADVDL